MDGELAERWNANNPKGTLVSVSLRSGETLSAPTPTHRAAVGRFRAGGALRCSGIVDGFSTVYRGVNYRGCCGIGGKSSPESDAIISDLAE